MITDAPNYRWIVNNRPTRLKFVENLHIRLFETETVLLQSYWWNKTNVRSSFWRFYMNYGEGAFLEFEGTTHSLVSNRLYFIPAGVPFGYHCNQNVTQFFVHFDVLGLLRITLHELFDRLICLPKMPELQANVVQIADELQTSTYDPLDIQCRIKSLLFTGLAQYIRNVRPERMDRSLRLTKALEPILPAIHAIEMNVQQHWSNAELALQCNLNEDYFIRCFRERVGETPIQYILKHRVNLAAQHLLFTNHSIEDIATMTGFGNRAYFSRIFTRLMGMPPGAYRKSSK